MAGDRRTGQYVRVSNTVSNPVPVSFNLPDPPPGATKVSDRIAQLVLKNSSVSKTYTVQANKKLTLQNLVFVLVTTGFGTADIRTEFIKNKGIAGEKVISYGLGTGSVAVNEVLSANDTITIDIYNNSSADYKMSSEWIGYLEDV